MNNFKEPVVRVVHQLVAAPHIASVSQTDLHRHQSVALSERDEVGISYFRCWSDDRV